MNNLNAEARKLTLNSEQNYNNNNSRSAKINLNSVNNFMMESEKKFSEMQKGLNVEDDKIYKSKLLDLIKKNESSENLLGNKRLAKDK